MANKRIIKSDYIESSNNNNKGNNEIKDLKLKASELDSQINDNQSPDNIESKKDNTSKSIEEIDDNELKDNKNETDEEAEDDGNETDEESDDENEIDEEIDKGIDQKTDEPDEDIEENKSANRETKDDSKQKEEQMGKRGPQPKSDSVKKDIDDKNDNTKRKSIPKLPLKQKVNNHTNSTTNKVKDNTEKVAKLAAKGGNLLLHLLKILINPISWIILLIVILIAYFSSALSTVGKNDFNEMCDSTGTGAVLIGSDADDFTRQSSIAAWLTSTPFKFNGDKPMTREQASGVLGNFIQESYDANPIAIEGDGGKEAWKTCNNSCVLGWGNVGGKGIGIAQWDRGRRTGLVNFATQSGTQWHDLNTQLQFLKKELDSGYEASQLKRGNFNDLTKSIEEYTRIWEEYFERAAPGTLQSQKRVDYAIDFSQKYQGGGGPISGGGLSNNCIGGGALGGVDTSNVIQLAIQSSYTNRNDSKISCSTLVNCGINLATPAYVEAKRIAEENTGADPIKGLFASCDRFVATMVRSTGTDVNFPWGSSTTQGNYMKSSPDWQLVSCQDRKPGDVLWRQGHIMLYIGMVDGVDSSASASIARPGVVGRVGAIGKVYCNGTKFNADAGPADGYRKVR